MHKHLKKDTTNVKRIILEGVKDHVVSNLHGNETPIEMWKNIKYLFKSSSEA